MIHQYLSSNLRHYRFRKKMRQQDVASQLHIERQTYSNYENGKRTPSLETLIRISDLLDVTLDDLLNSCSKNI